MCVCVCVCAWQGVKGGCIDRVCSCILYVKLFCGCGVCVFVCACVCGCVRVCVSVCLSSHLSKEGVLVIQLVGPTESEEELAAVVVGPPIGHAHHSPSDKLQPGVELILNQERTMEGNFFTLTAKVNMKYCSMEC